MAISDETKTAAVSRRSLLKAGAGLAGAGLATRLSAFPTPAIGAEPVTLRYLSTATNQSPAIAEKAMEEAGVKIEYVTVTTDEVAKRIITQPNSFDLVDSEYFSLPNLVPSGNLMGMDAKKIKLADKITPVLTKGTIDGKDVGSQGSAPWKYFYLDGRHSKKFAEAPTEWMTLIPTTYNADSLGDRPDLIDGEVTHWSALLDPKFKGKAALINIPSIGIMDAAMAIESSGQFKYKDKGNMTKAEIDKTMEILTKAKKDGQFRAFWTDFNQSVNLMASGEVVIQSMWSPAVTAVRSKGIKCTYLALEEGYRGWASGFALPRTLRDKKLDAAYEFINWFLSGWAGAYLSRQGYYPAVLDTAKEKMEPYEWAYWYEGKPAEKPIKAPDGTVIEQPGAVRDGGSYETRMSRIACWNSVMDENEYLITKWNEFVAA
ncbi:ABC transporter substrate-binding protein [Jiella sonneratiae]|uniref:Extracellular solute-binding protein n=1 Tax=Jiella sonneratiae TaxID=2816856 RepID=A0ABS3J8J0_9HYPH|nr:extracellular solute-binding protein [Jiella sonneratiae]MBO0905422.1 extracellular solute-binding protein [Jiella sonneratiae]